METVVLLKEFCMREGHLTVRISHQNNSLHIQAVSDKGYSYGTPVEDQIGDSLLPLLINTIASTFTTLLGINSIQNSADGIVKAVTLIKTLLSRRVQELIKLNGRVLNHQY